MLLLFLSVRLVCSYIAVVQRICTPCNFQLFFFLKLSILIIHVHGKHVSDIAFEYCLMNVRLKFVGKFVMDMKLCSQTLSNQHKNTLLRD